MKNFTILATVLVALLMPVSAHDEVDPQVARIMMIHGTTGPFVVAGFRMGDAALRTLGLKRGSSDLEVIHHSPREVQWSCIADGLMAATGVSPGKLNLKLETSTATYSIVRNKATGKQVRLELTPEFQKQYLNLPMSRMTAEGLKVLRAPESGVFVVKQ